MGKSNRVGLIPIILMSPLFMLYFFELFGLVYLEVVYAGLIIFVGFIFNSKGRSLDNTMTKYSLHMLLYFIFLILVVALSNLSAIDTNYSLLRGLYSLSLYLFMFFVYKGVSENYIAKVNWRTFLTRAFTLTLLIIIIGQLTIPEWRSGIGGIRLSGGTNSNFVSFFALFVIFTSHFNSLLNNKWKKIDQFNWMLGAIVLFWSMSRSAILGFVVFYAIYIGWYFLKGYLTVFLRGRLPKSLIKNSLIAAVALLVGYFIVRYILPESLLNQIMLRFTGEEGLSSRVVAWDILLDHFQSNPLFGGVGWFYSPEVLPGQSGIADSAHNSYIRILSEIGLVGLVPIMILPTIIIIGLLIKAYKEKDLRMEKIFVIAGAYLTGLFSILFFENHFLSGLFRQSNLVIILIISLGYVLCVKKDVISVSTESTVVENKGAKKFTRKKYKIVW